jgi:hypothetical protein
LKIEIYTKTLDHKQNFSPQIDLTATPLRMKSPQLSLETPLEGNQEIPSLTIKISQHPNNK